jgi:hypothetical protein
LKIVSPTTRYLQQFPAAQNRVYTRTELFSEEFNHHPRLESPNLTALYGLQNVAGMEPLILDRFSRALGNVGPDSVTPIAGYPPNDDIFSARSHVLDLLNTTHVVSFTNLSPFEDPLTYKDGVGVSVADLGLVAKPGEKVRLSGSRTPANQLVLVTSLANSVTVEQGATVARIRATMDDDSVHELSLRAGIDTAEWAHERPDVFSIRDPVMAPIHLSQIDTGPDLIYRTCKPSRVWRLRTSRAKRRWDSGEQRFTIRSQALRSPFPEQVRPNSGISFIQKIESKY